MDAGGRFTCPDCRLELPVVSSGHVVARRCPRCRGVWLDPDSFHRLCEDESSSPTEDTAIVSSRGPAPAEHRTPPPEDRVRYRACPACGDTMSRSNFAKVSGVVIDLCRPHGAWFDKGELSAIRRFLRAGGLRRYERRRRLDAERSSSVATGGPLPLAQSADDIYDVLVGDNAGWDVPSRVPRLLLAILFATLGVFLLWHAFHPHGHFGRRWSADGGALAGLVSLYLAWRALREWWARLG